jgi:hypothetical protein
MSCTQHPYKVYKQVTVLIAATASDDKNELHNKIDAQ